MESSLNGLLTHKDRTFIRKSLSKVSLDPSEKDEDLILLISLHLRDHPPTNGSEKSYQQFLVDLINFLRQNPDDSRSEIVRRTLKFMQPSADTSSIHIIPAVKAFIAGFALHEISDSGKLLLADEIRGLSQQEKQDAEEMLLDLVSNTVHSDDELIEQTRKFIAGFGGGETTCIVNRFLRNIRKLSKVLSGNGEWTAEQKTWARGALKYLHLNEDVIADDLGIIGLLDDMYVAATAVQFIGPVVQSIEEIISDLYAAWPFLRDLVLTYKDSEYIYSEFALINAALACPALTDHEKVNRSALIIPSSGITSFMIAFGAALGAAYDAASSGADILSFRPGQKVRVDNEAVAIYDGVDEIGGHKYIRLKRYSTRGGQQLDTIFRIPEGQVGRLCPAPDDAALIGNIPTQIDDAEIQLGGTEALFHLPLPQQFSKISGRVWLVSQVSSVRALASELSVYGYPLSAVLPMGHIKRDGELSRWDARFGKTECLITTVSDLDLAAEILEEQELTSEDIVVIDLSGLNSNKFASLGQIQSLDARVLCIAEEKDTETIRQLDVNHYEFWEWSPEEVGELASENKGGADGAHPFNCNDGSVIRSLLLKPNIRVVSNSEAEKAKTDLDNLGRHVRRAGDDAPEDLREILDELLDIVFGLIRLPMPLNKLLGGPYKLISSLDMLSEKTQLSLYLNEEEKALATAAVESMQYFALSLENENLKTDAICEAVRSDGRVRIVLPPRLPAGMSLSDYVSEDTDLYLPLQGIRDVEYDLLVVPYWPGRQKAWNILSNPPSCGISFILYSFEDEWRSAFYRELERSRAQRARHSRRSVIFRGQHKWNPPPVIEPTSVGAEKEAEVDAMIEDRDSWFRQRLVHAARRGCGVADTEAWMVVFRGGAHAFFTPDHEAWSATHLLSEPSDDADNEEKLVAVKVNDIAENDVLVFMRGTNRDAIRELADASLPSGMRETAKLWQKALRAYVEEKGLSLAELRRQLKNAGCERHIVTLRLWLESETLIGPRYYATGDLEAIAEVTGAPEFRERMAECAKAINRVWGEHMRASQVIAQRVVSGIEGRIRKDLNLGAPLDIDDRLVLVQVEYVATERVMVPASTVNQLRDGI